ncbi:MAG: polysaccharide biosynthesis protein [Gammaproteobacteria bacterium]|nr:polysaccharide biosynthesis protein [Gammaproteobacteria bacterium]
MSKIEKALNRAATERRLALVPADAKRVPIAEGQNIVPTVSPEIESRARASAAIALMREPSPKDAAELAAKRIIFPEMGENSTVKAFREIRTKVLQASNGRNCVLMVTALDGQSGSTFVALNLSSAFAFDEGKTALLFDCNLRNPKLHLLLNQKSLTGLTDYLENPEMDLAEIIHPVGIERLRVVPAGGRREIPGEYFTSARMKGVLDTVRARYPERFIILDSPPMTESADTQILAELCDYIVLVVPYGTVTHTQIDNGIKALDKKKLLGVVFNNEPQLPQFRKQRERR